MSAHKKLIAVLDSNHLVTYIAKGIKITEGPHDSGLVFPHHKRQEKDHGSYSASFGHNVSQSDKHTSPKEIDFHNAAKIICEYLQKLFQETPEYKDLIIVAEPKMLGFVRKNLSDNLSKMVVKEVRKDLVKQDRAAIEAAIFG